MFTHPKLSVLKQRIEETRNFIQVIIGPRQVGKTTLVKQLCQSIIIPWHYASADDISASGETWIMQQWETIRFKLSESEASEAILFIDEIQKIQNWSETIKAQWDRDSFDNTQIKLVILGSASLIIQKGLTESLAGRFEIIRMTHWGFSEMNAAFDMSAAEYCWFGGYPGLAHLISDEKRWRDYLLNSLIETTISKDILMMVKVDKPTLLKRLFELGCAYSGQILSFNKILGQLQDAGNTTTLSNYLELLETSGLLCGIEKYSGSVIRQRSSSPKWQVQNPALYSIMTGKTYNYAIKNPSFWGRCVETAVGSHLYNSCIATGIKLFYWREANYEVDFVLEFNNKVIAIEVKSGHSSHTKGMEIFNKRYSPLKVLLVGNDGIRWEEFIKTNPLQFFQ